MSNAEGQKLLKVEEGQFSDVKSKAIPPANLSKGISAFANSDGGDLYLGIEELIPDKHRNWDGYENSEAANGHLQAFERLFPLGNDFQYEFISAQGFPGYVLHVQVHRTQGIIKASNGIPYIRRGAQNLPVESQEAVKRLEYTKGIESFETESTNVLKDAVTDSVVVRAFVEQVVPTSTPENWLRKQVLLRDDKPTVAAVLLFSDEPQAHLPKRCGIKAYRYKTVEAQGTRETLAFDPRTVEGCLYEQIKDVVRLTTEIVESIPRLGESALEAIRYPQETLHEIITNAVLHRDYSVADDVHIRIFDNRVEVQSPGRLPAHITTQNILDERFARNGAVVRILNKFPDPPNKDVGEGLNTAFEAMNQLGLKEPTIVELDNAVLVTIKHEALASPEEAVMDFLENHPSIRNAEARKITHVRADYQMKAVFNRMVKKGLIEQIPGTRTAATAYRKVQVESLPVGAEQGAFDIMTAEVSN